MKPTWKPQRVKLGQIQAWEGNPRMSTKAQAQRIINSERTFGQPVPFLLAPEQDGKFLLYDGHQRLSAWFTVYGAEHVMDAMVADRPLTEAEHKELVVTLHTGATGSWNWETLGSWSAGDLQQWGMNADTLKAWNNDANNLKELLKSETVEPVDAEPQIDRAAELAEKWHTATGQLWKLGEHRLLIGDCTVRENVERLMGGERANIVFTDPPYGIEYDNTERWEGSKKQSAGAAISRGAMIEGDDKEFDPSFILETFKNCREIFLWGMQYYLGKLPNGGVIVWNRKLEQQKDTPFADFELCWSKQQRHKMAWIMWGGWKSKEKGEERLHTTQKPIELAEWFFEKWTKEGEIIVDLYAGAGFSIIAAHNLNRRCYAMEISEKYGAVILERFFTATGITPELIL